MKITFSSLLCLTRDNTYWLETTAPLQSLRSENNRYDIINNAAVDDVTKQTWLFKDLDRMTCPCFDWTCWIIMDPTADQGCLYNLDTILDVNMPHLKWYSSIIWSFKLHKITLSSSHQIHCFGWDERSSVISNQCVFKYAGWYTMGLLTLQRLSELCLWISRAWHLVVS